MRRGGRFGSLAADLRCPRHVCSSSDRPNCRNAKEGLGASAWRSSPPCDEPRRRWSKLARLFWSPTHLITKGHYCQRQGCSSENDRGPSNDFLRSRCFALRIGSFDLSICYASVRGLSQAPSQPQLQFRLVSFGRTLAIVLLHLLIIQPFVSPYVSIKRDDMKHVSVPIGPTRREAAGGYGIWRG
jgi:hypothetical protein